MILAVETRIDLARPASEVFAFVAIGWFNNGALWRPELVEVTPLDGAAIQVGARGVELRRVRRGKRRNAPEGRTFEVTELLSPGTAALSAKQGPGIFALSGLEDRPGAELYTSRFLFEPIGGARCRLRWRCTREYQNPLFLLPSPLIKFRLRREMNRSLKLLKVRVESAG